MSASTTKALSLGLVAALWAIASHFLKLPFQLWPILVGLACFVGAGSGVSALQKSVVGTAAGVVWAMVYVLVSGALGRQEIVDALVFGAVVFGIIYLARLPLLSYTAGVLMGAATYLGSGIRTVALNSGIRVVLALAIGCALGIVAERIAEMLGRMRVVPSMSNR